MFPLFFLGTLLAGFAGLTGRAGFTGGFTAGLAAFLAGGLAAFLLGGGSLSGFFLGRDLDFVAGLDFVAVLDAIGAFKILDRNALALGNLGE